MKLLLEKASKKYLTLARMCKYMKKRKFSILINAFIISHFAHCTTVWISGSWTMNSRVSKIHKKSFKTWLQRWNKPFFWWFAEKGQTGKYLPKKLQILVRKAWNYEIYFSLSAKTRQSEK